VKSLALKLIQWVIHLNALYFYKATYLMSKKIDQKTKKIEETLWQSCDKLRGSIEPAEYKHVLRISLDLPYEKSNTTIIEAPF
jgi:hypothetical protein